MDSPDRNAGPRWYLFLHQVPPTPPYFRARVLRQLNQLGAVPIKKSAYILPANEETLEDLQWLRRSIVSEDGDAWIFAADAVAGHSDDGLRALFVQQSTEQWSALANEVRGLLEELRAAHSSSESEDGRPSTESGVRKLLRRVAAIAEVDYFGSSGRKEVDELMNELERVRSASNATVKSPESIANELHARRWVTRRGIKVDRMASAWLIRRFIDPSPEFAFVDPARYKHAPSELRFDMFEGEFTHEGLLCTFEVLRKLVKHDDPGLDALAEIVHDIDLKEAHRRGETAGVALVIDGIVSRHADDDSRLRAGTELFDALYAKLKAH